MGVTGRLSVMMFLQYVIWGSWLPLLALYLSRFLGFSGTHIGWVFATLAIASVSAVFIGGQVADRLMATERFLAVSHLIGGLAMFALPFQKSFWPFFLDARALADVRADPFGHQLDLVREPQRCAEGVREGADGGHDRLDRGSWPLVFMLQGKEGAALESALTGIFLVSGVASIVLAGYSLTLPHTPPGRAARRSLPWKRQIARGAESRGALHGHVHRCPVHAGYFQRTSRFLADIGLAENLIMPAMSIGQIAEIGTMAVLGRLFKRLGWRKTMTFGILGHAIRFAIYSLGGPVWLVVACRSLHGVCYAFFFATVYIFVDEVFPERRPQQRAGLVQPADPRARTLSRQSPLGKTGRCTDH